MPRPKGSKNKKKEKIVEKNGGTSIPEGFELPETTPEIEVDEIVDVPAKEFVDEIVGGCKNCRHDKELHYKSGDRSTDWCNRAGCSCLAFEK